MLEQNHPVNSQFIDKILAKLRYLIPYSYLIYAIMIMADYSDCFARLFIIDFILMHIILINPKSLYNYDSLMIILFFLWIIENDNEKTDDTCLQTNENIFLIFTLGFFKGALWIMSCAMFIGTGCIIFLLIRDIFFRRNFANQIEVSNGLTQDQIDSLPKFKYNKIDLNGSFSDDKNEVCAICLCDFEQDELMLKLPLCNHIFHSNCVTNWISRNSFCPYCRRQISIHENDKSPIIPQNNVIIEVPPLNNNDEMQIYVSDADPNPKNSYYQLPSEMQILEEKI